MPVTNTLITQSYLLPDIATALLSYDRLRWYRSTTGQTGGYEAVTAALATAAELRGTPISAALNGKILQLRINGVTDIEVTFAGADPITGAEAAAEIEAASVLLAVSMDGAELVISTVATGTAASLEIVGGSAAPYLGLIIGDSITGLAADDTLVAGTHEYFLDDANSAEDYWYCVELRLADDSLISARSVPMPSRLVHSVPISETIGCFVRLADLAGRPLVSRNVTIYNVQMPNKFEVGASLWGVFRLSETAATDSSGYASMRLPRGATLDVSIEGTGFTRRITLPDVGDLVDLLNPDLAAGDEFAIQEPNIDYAIRTS
jgi:hypothetical protein